MSDLKRVPDARKLPGWPHVSRGVCETCQRPYSPREQWSFTGRETHWGFDFLIWTRDDGERYARFIK